jgi:flavin reductase (DIM6/NTAB) family NADH-FMN oxidoreductase RutF
MIIDPSTLSTKEVYKLLIGSVVPRPIAWVSSMNGKGELNLAPFSFFNVASRRPPTLAISIGPGVGEREGTIKDTLVNIQETKEYVINIVTFSLANEMHISSDNFPTEVNEFEQVGVTPAACEMVKVPRVKEAPISMECKLSHVIPIGQDTLVLGEMVRFHVADELYHEGRINLEKLEPIGRLAGNYSLVDTLFNLPHDNLESVKRQRKS